jgi:hypothetical protein
MKLLGGSVLNRNLGYEEAILQIDRVVILPIRVGFMASALCLFCGVLSGASLFAQDQSQAVTCSVEGPSITDTLNYVNAALSGTGRAPLADPGLITITVDGDYLVVTEKHVDDKGMEFLFVFKALSTLLKCPAPVNLRQNGGTSNSVGLQCLERSCVNMSHTQRIGDGWGMEDGIPEDSEWLSFSQCDDVCGVRLARAFSHLIALLQQQTRDKLRNNDKPNDPFANPQ